MRTKKPACEGFSARDLGAEGMGRTALPVLDESLLALEDALFDRQSRGVGAVGVLDQVEVTHGSRGGDEVVELRKVIPFGLRRV